MMATSITVPVMMVFSFLPMLSMFNDGIAKVAKITYSQQVNIMLNQIGQVDVKTEQIGVIAVNMVIAIALFVIAYRKTGLE